MDSKLIDPHLDQIPPDELTEEERNARRHAPPRPGLSIDQTIAHNANNSVGAVGVKTSEVDSGPQIDQDLSKVLPEPSRPVPIKK